MGQTLKFMKKIILIFTLLISIFSAYDLSAQHTVGVSMGASQGSFRPYPSQETKSVSGLLVGGVSWRYYSAQKYVGAVGIDIEYMERGYSYAPNASVAEDKNALDYYTRYFNSIMIPIVWQPHIYAIHNKFRIFLDAAATFSYNMSSTYVNDYARAQGATDWQGDYEYKTARDNRVGYGLMGGFGINYIFGRFELMARARYYYGYADIVKNRNKYYTNNNDGSENPFSITPTRSPVDNISVAFGLNYRLGRADGFESWGQKRYEKVKIGTNFNYEGKR